jgi:two-component system, NtrC family, sensor kinase
MKKIFFLLLLTLLSITKAIAQNNLPPAYEIKTDTAVNITLGDAYWQMLENRSGEWTIDQVSESPLAEKFHPNNTKKKGIDYSIQAYWVRYRLRNSMTHEARIAIAKNITHADLYTRNIDRKWNHKRTGFGVPWSKRNDLKRITTLTYILPPGSELLIYERNNFDYDVNIPGLPGLPAMGFGFTEKVLQEQYLDSNSDILPSILFGFLILAALFNIYFFLITRERVYLFFSLMILSRAFASFLFDTDFFLREHPIMKWYITSISVFFYFIFWIHFVRYFLETFKYVPRWDKLLIGLNMYTIFIWALLLGRFKRNEEPGVGIIMLITNITFLLFIRSGNKSIRWRIVAVLPAMAILIIPLSNFFFRLLEKYTGKNVPSFITWAFNNFSTLEQIGFVWLLIFFSWSLFRRYEQLQKQITQETLAKEQLAKEKAMERSLLIAEQKIQLEKEVEERTAELKHSLRELKSTQAQLIQQEKMASLGELTAGIAHEIQNPLNFVNNFSDINTELVGEAKQEIDKGNISEVKAILNDIKDNEEKINQHGKRADAIVKGMLQHSRHSDGKKEPTDINKLADEFLRLAYHGLRAKDKSFNATLNTNYDESIGNINIIPQEIGRVILNLINNAFYAVQIKQREASSEGLTTFQKLSTLYEPTVSVNTKKVGDKVEIKVADNGNGIPQKIVDKIFQPFFTTKPTGQGTGLGLSLSYDIVKAHGGEIKVDTREGEGSEFVISLPV